MKKFYCVMSSWLGGFKPSTLWSLNLGGKCCNTVATTSAICAGVLWNNDIEIASFEMLGNHYDIILYYDKKCYSVESWCIVGFKTLQFASSSASLFSYTVSSLTLWLPRLPSIQTDTNFVHFCVKYIHLGNCDIQSVMNNLVLFEVNWYK